MGYLMMSEVKEVKEAKSKRLPETAVILFLRNVCDAFDSFVLVLCDQTVGSVYSKEIAPQ